MIGYSGRAPCVSSMSFDPVLVFVQRVDREADDLHAALLELGLDAGHVAELGRADRGEVFRVGEQDHPRAVDPVVEFDPSFRRVGLEIWGHVTELAVPSKPLLSRFFSFT